MVLYTNKYIMAGTDEFRAALQAHRRKGKDTRLRAMEKPRMVAAFLVLLALIGMIVAIIWVATA